MTKMETTEVVKMAEIFSAVLDGKLAQMNQKVETQKQAVKSKKSTKSKTAKEPADPKLKEIAEEKLANWNRMKNAVYSNPEIVGYTAKTVKFAFNSYGRRLVNSYKLNGDFLKKIGKGKVVGKAKYRTPKEQ